MQPSTRTILATTEIFDNFNDAQLTLVAALCTPVTYNQGHVLLNENDQSDEMYIIGRGGVEVLVNPSAVGAAAGPAGVSPVVLTELRQGQVVGEVALVDQGVRSATMRVSRDETLLLRLRRDQLMRLCETYPGSSAPEARLLSHWATRSGLSDKVSDRNQPFLTSTVCSIIQQPVPERLHVLPRNARSD